MTIFASNKLRTIGGASVIALSAGFAAPAVAQSAPAPLAALPGAPTAPAVPANIQQCAETSPGIFICDIGEDPDGTGVDPLSPPGADRVRVTVREGALISGGGATPFASGVELNETGILTNFGSIDTGTFVAASVNSDGVINNLGYIGSDNGAYTLNTNFRVLFRNTGTIYNSGSGSAIAGFGGKTVINRGLIQADNGIAIFTSNFLGVTTTVTNEVTGSILSGGDFGAAILVREDLLVDNAGLIQAFGNTSSAIIATGALELTNSGNIVNESGTTIVADGFADIRNNFGGLIEARDGNAIDLGTAGSRVINNETITANGGSSVNAGSLADISVINNGAMSGTSQTIRAGSNLLVVNRGSLDATGAFAIATIDNFELRNLGSITAAGNAVRATDNALIQNNGGSITSTNARALLLAGTSEVINDLGGTISGATGIDALGLTDIRNNAGGTIEGTSGDAIALGAAGSRVINTGTVSAAGGNAVDATGLADISVITNDTMTSDDIGIIAGDNLLVVNRGTLTTAAAGAIVGDGTGLTVRNLGDISSTGGEAVSGGADVTIDNSGSITANGANAIVLGGGTVTNEAGASITGNIGIFGVAGSTDSHTVVNFGSITGGIGEAVFLGAGADEFQQWTGAVVNGNVRLGADDDTFILEGTMSSITGDVLGGAGNDTAILGGTLDGDNLDSFETISLGQLFDLTVSGARTLTGATSVDGNVTFGLGVDSIAVDGDVDLAGGNITVQTPLDAALLGQTVSLITATGTLSDNGTTFTIIDDDLLVDYARIAGTADIQIIGVDPLIGSGDRNVVAISNAVFGGISANTISAANFAALNGLADANALQNALLDALPSLSDGVGREIFETSSAASDALDRHLMQGESSIWGQIIVRGADQDALSQSAAGYDADETIFTLGGDFALGDSIVIGALASYADIEISDTTTGSSSVASEVESIKLGLYTGIELFDRGFFNAEIAYLTGSVDTVSGGFFGPIVSGYDFDGIAGRATLGYDLLEDENIWLTPSIGINLANINFDDAVETGGFGFTVARGDAEYLELRAGVELGSQISEGVTGFVKGTVIHDTVDSVRSFRLSSAQLPTFSAVLPVRSQDRFELAAGLDAEVTDNVHIGVGYLGDFGDGYTGHAGRATLRIGF